MSKLNKKDFSNFLNNSKLYDSLNHSDTEDAYVNLKTGEFILLFENEIRRIFSEGHSITWKYNIKILNIFQVEELLYKEQLDKLNSINNDEETNLSCKKLKM